MKRKIVLKSLISIVALLAVFAVPVSAAGREDRCGHGTGSEICRASMPDTGHPSRGDGAWDTG